MRRLALSKGWWIEGAEACYEYLLQYDISPLLSKFLLRLIYLVLKCNTLSFGSRFFHQINPIQYGLFLKH